MCIQCKCIHVHVLVYIFTRFHSSFFVILLSLRYIYSVYIYISAASDIIYTYVNLPARVDNHNTIPGIVENDVDPPLTTGIIYTTIVPAGMVQD